MLAWLSDLFHSTKLGRWASLRRRTSPVMTTFKLSKVFPGVEVTLPSSPSSTCTADQLLSFIPFNNWLVTLKKSLDDQSQRGHEFYARDARYSLRSIKVLSVYWFGKRIGFVKMEAVVRNNKNNENPLPGLVFLRGGSVAILMSKDA